MTQTIRLEDASGRIVTYATVPAGLLPSNAIMWRDRVFHAFGQFRDAKNPEMAFDDPRQPQPVLCFREKRDEDGNDPVTCFAINDPNTPRNKP